MRKVSLVAAGAFVALACQTIVEDMPNKSSGGTSNAAPVVIVPLPLGTATPPANPAATVPPTAAPTAGPTAGPTAAPTKAPAAGPTPASCPSLAKVSIGAQPHVTSESRIDGIIYTCNVWDTTPRFGNCGTNGGPCNPEHHGVCEANNIDNGPNWRLCEYAAEPYWSISGIRDGYQFQHSVGEWGYQIKVCGLPGEQYEISVGPPSGARDQLGQALSVCPGVDDSRKWTF